MTKLRFYLALLGISAFRTQNWELIISACPSCIQQKLLYLLYGKNHERIFPIDPKTIKHTHALTHTCLKILYV